MAVFALKGRAFLGNFEQKYSFWGPVRSSVKNVCLFFHRFSFSFHFVFISLDFANRFHSKSLPLHLRAVKRPPPATTLKIVLCPFFLLLFSEICGNSYVISGEGRSNMWRGTKKTARRKKKSRFRDEKKKQKIFER